MYRGLKKTWPTRRPSDWRGYKEVAEAKIDYLIVDSPKKLDGSQAHEKKNFCTFLALYGR